MNRNLYIRILYTIYVYYNMFIKGKNIRSTRCLLMGKNIRSTRCLLRVNIYVPLGV